ncbi:MAG: HEAT repeat domain-containing protein [Planctomycetota bacterium]
MADDGNAAVSAAIGDLADPDPARRAAAAERLCQAGERARSASVDLVRACGDADESVREWAVAALEAIGPPPPTLVPGLAELATARSQLVAYWAITLLGRSGKDAATVLETLTQCVASTDLAVAQRAAWALGRIGPAAAAAVSALRDAASRGDERLTRLATESIAAIGA